MAGGITGGIETVVDDAVQRHTALRESHLADQHLMKDGHSVTLIDKNDTVGTETSWGNAGHGHIGWTMSHGSARIIADLVANRAPALSVEAINN